MAKAIQSRILELVESVVKSRNSRDKRKIATTHSRRGHVIDDHGSDVVSLLGKIGKPAFRTTRQHAKDAAKQPAAAAVGTSPVRGAAHDSHERRSLHGVRYRASSVAQTHSADHRNFWESGCNSSDADGAVNAQARIACALRNICAGLNLNSLHDSRKGKSQMVPQFRRANCGGANSATAGPQTKKYSLSVIETHRSNPIAPFRDMILRWT